MENEIIDTPILHALENISFIKPNAGVSDSFKIDNDYFIYYRVLTNSMLTNFEYIIIYDIKSGNQEPLNPISFETLFDNLNDEYKKELCFYLNVFAK